MSSSLSTFSKNVKKLIFFWHHTIFDGALLQCFGNTFPFTAKYWNIPCKFCVLWAVCIRHEPLNSNHQFDFRFTYLTFKIKLKTYCFTYKNFLLRETDKVIKLYSYWYHSSFSYIDSRVAPPLQVWCTRRTEYSGLQKLT